MKQLLIPENQKIQKKKSLAMSYIYIAIITMLYNDLMKNSVIYLYWLGGEKYQEIGSWFLSSTVENQ